MSGELSGRYDVHRQGNSGRMIHAWSYVDSEGIRYHLIIEGRDIPRKRFEVDAAAVNRLGAAVTALEADPAIEREFQVTPELTLSCSPARVALLNCEASYDFASAAKLESCGNDWPSVECSSNCSANV